MDLSWKILLELVPSNLPCSWTIGKTFVPRLSLQWYPHGVMLYSDWLKANRILWIMISIGKIPPNSRVDLMSISQKPNPYGYRRASTSMLVPSTLCMIGRWPELDKDTVVKGCLHAYNLTYDLCKEDRIEWVPSLTKCYGHVSQLLCQVWKSHPTLIHFEEALEEKKPPLLSLAPMPHVLSLATP